ncbi:hypothetical protein NEOLI_000958 [Neolecta irregularis DAH-3]|uniref:Wax synthase domain-containing protein n=1 Tax=Neolecta irregularis (strain DAH-3) TaxID=1198029 RepID=A0A1U7LGJ2_NEOID|nr:hypothetical protein NEOLI_000958 [Neolecta irregularis DAH-3]|eukprot:OLL21776.1 hypothetical protein NEOLI_000958 [Neolecta irregularis DAH-3]
MPGPFAEYRLSLRLLVGFITVAETFNKVTGPSSPSLFGSLLRTRSAREFYGKSWHQIYRSPFNSMAYQPVERLLGRGGIYHAYPLMTMGGVLGMMTGMIPVLFTWAICTFEDQILGKGMLRRISFWVMMAISCIVIHRETANLEQLFKDQREFLYPKLKMTLAAIMYVKNIIADR